MASRFRRSISSRTSISISAIAQIVSATNSIRALMPPGIQAPIVVQFNASSVPVLQISLSSDKLNEQQLYDYGIYQFAPADWRRSMASRCPRPPAANTGRSWSISTRRSFSPRGLTPLGRRQRRQCAEPDAAHRHGQDRRHAVHGPHQRNAARPSTTSTTFPSRSSDGATVFMKDIGQVRDGSARAAERRSAEDGDRVVLLSIIKNGNASTLDVVNGGQEGPAGRAGRRAPRPRHQGAVRPVGVRHRIGRRRASRRRDRRRTHGADDPALSRFMAIDTGRHDLDSARHPVLARRAVLPRRDAQHDDARRPGARRRHPRRRFDGDDREHAPPADGGSTCRCREATLHGAAASPCRPWCRPSPSAASSPPWSSSRVRPNICSRRWALLSCSRCSPPTGCREP